MSKASRRLPQALIGLTLLSSAPAWADSQCTPAAPAPLPVSLSATPPAPKGAAPGAPSGGAPSYVAPADRAAGAGLHELTADEIAKIPGLKPIVAAGARIFSMGRVGEAPDMVAFHDRNFQLLAPMADPHFVCRGVVSDDQGNNVSLSDAVKVPGLVAPPDRPVLKDISTPKEAIDIVSKAAFGSLGPVTAPIVWIVIDPLCPHSQDTVSALIPYAQAGKLRLNILPVDAFGQTSSKAVHALLSETSDHMIQRWFEPGLQEASYGPDAEPKFIANHMILAGLMDGQMHVSGVPEVLWTSSDGIAHAQQGLDPQNVPTFIASLGK